MEAIQLESARPFKPAGTKSPPTEASERGRRELDLETYPRVCIRRGSAAKKARVLSPARSGLSGIDAGSSKVNYPYREKKRVIETEALKPFVLLNNFGRDVLCQKAANKNQTKKVV